MHKKKGGEGEAKSPRWTNAIDRREKGGGGTLPIGGARERRTDVKLRAKKKL